MAAGLGYTLWRQLSQVIFLDLNMRSAGPLGRLLQQMRSGTISPDVWASLEERVLRQTTNNEPDPRLKQPPFSTETVHCVVHRHALRVPLAYSHALRDSILKRQLFYVLHACDEVSPEDIPHFDSGVRQRLLQIPNPRHTGRLPGILPLYKGLRLCLYNCKDCVQLGLMNGAEVEVVDILFAPPEWNGLEPKFHPGDLNVLRFIPQALVLRTIGASWTLPRQCRLGLSAADDVPGTFILKPAIETFQYKDKLNQQPLRVTRTMFPVIPASTCIVYGAQGESWRAVLADLSCPPRMTPEVHWLANYVMLSRARDLSGLLLIRNAERRQLERGPPAHLVAEIDRLLRLERACASDVQAQLQKVKHLPPEILQLFQPTIAESQVSRHQQHMAECASTNVATEPPRRRLRGKQPCEPAPCPPPLLPGALSYVFFPIFHNIRIVWLHHLSC